MIGLELTDYNLDKSVINHKSRAQDGSSQPKLLFS